MAARSTCAKAAGIATRSRLARCWPTPNAAVEGRGFAHFDARRVRLRHPAHVRHQAHGAGPFARGRQVRHAMAPHAFPQSARPGARLGDAAVPVDRRRPQGIQRRWWPICKRWDAPRTGVPTTTTRGDAMHDYVYPSIFFSYFLFFTMLLAVRRVLLRAVHQGRLLGKDSEEIKYRMLTTTTRSQE